MICAIKISDDGDFTCVGPFPSIAVASEWIIDLIETVRTTEPWYVIDPENPDMSPDEYERYPNANA